MQGHWGRSTSKHSAVTCPESPGHGTSPPITLELNDVYYDVTDGCGKWGELWYPPALNETPLYREKGISKGGSSFEPGVGFFWYV